MNAKAKLLVLSALLVAGAVALIVTQQGRLQSLREDAEKLREQLRSLQEEHEQSAVSMKAGREAHGSPDRLELMRLRAEVSRLSKLTATNAASKPTQPERVQVQRSGDAAIDRLFESLNRDPLPEEIPIITKVANKEKDLKSWWEALQAYAQNHAGLTPNSISDLQSYLPPGFQGSIDVSGFTFEKGVALNSLAEGQVIYKEPNPLALTDGVVCNVWLFANGRIDLFQ
jgi:hypothetical protein